MHTCSISKTICNALLAWLLHSFVGVSARGAAVAAAATAATCRVDLRALADLPYPGPWGGMRCAMALRPYLSELGCLPISKLVGFPAVTDLFDEAGAPKDPEARMLNQLPKALTELEWTAVAMKRQRDEFGLPNF